MGETSEAVRRAPPLRNPEPPGSRCALQLSRRRREDAHRACPHRRFPPGNSRESRRHGAVRARSAEPSLGRVARSCRRSFARRREILAQRPTCGVALRGKPAPKPPRLKATVLRASSAGRQLLARERALNAPSPRHQHRSMGDGVETQRADGTPSIEVRSSQQRGVQAAQGGGEAAGGRGAAGMQRAQLEARTAVPQGLATGPSAAVGCGGGGALGLTLGGSAAAGRVLLLRSVVRKFARS